MVKFKKKAKKALKLYFILVTLITVLLMILGSAFDSDRTFSYQAYASPLIYAAISVVPVFLFDQEKELSVKGFIIRNILEIIIIESIVLTIAFFAKTIPTEKISVAVGIAIGIVVVYGLTIVIDYMTEKAETKELNDQLIKYQRKMEVKES